MNEKKKSGPLYLLSEVSHHLRAEFEYATIISDPFKGSIVTTLEQKLKSSVFCVCMGCFVCKEQKAARVHLRVRVYHRNWGSLKQWERKIETKTATLMSSYHLE